MHTREKNESNRIECFLRGWMDWMAARERETQTTGKKREVCGKSERKKQTNNTGQKGKP